MAGVEERDKGRHGNDNNMITMTMLPLSLPPPDNLKKVTINSIGRTRWAIEGWETATAMATAMAMATATDGDSDGDCNGNGNGSGNGNGDTTINN